MNIDTALDGLDYATNKDNVSIDTNNSSIRFNAKDIDLIEQEDDNTIYISLMDNKLFLVDVNSIETITIAENTGGEME